MKLINNIWAKLLALFAAFYFYFLFANIGAPLGILCFPLFLAAIPVAIKYVFLEANLYLRSLISILLVFISDLLLRNYAGGTHDSAGNGFIVLFFIIGVVAFIISQIIIEIVKQKKEENYIKKMVLIIIFQVLFVIIHINYFGWYGMTIEVYSDSIKEAKEKNIIIDEYEIVRNTLIQDNDTLMFNEAWLEKKVEINHKQLIKQKHETGILELRLTFDKSHNKNYNPIEIIDRKINKSSKSYSNRISSQYENSIINRDSIVLNINYENIEDSIILVKKTPYNNVSYEKPF
jgi:hypothetical protein